MKMIVTGGGTGGHIYPAVSIADAYKAKHPETEILYVGRKQGLESELVPKLGLEFEPISIEYRRRGLSGALKHFISLGSSLFEAYRLIRKHKPDMIVGTGGYVSGPVMFVGALMGVRTAVHEANAFPGRANKLLSHMVDCVMVSFEESIHAFRDKDKVVLTGNPVRSEFYGLNREDCRRELGVSENEFMVLSVGGSGGAGKINDTMLDVMVRLSGETGYRIIHVTGKNYYDKFVSQAESRDGKLAGNIEVLPYVYNMPQHMGAADIMITRTGASTLAEIAVTGTPAILIPSPNVKDNHQEYNARTMEKMGAGVVLLESELDADRVSEILGSYKASPERLDMMRKSCETIPGKEALQLIVKTLESI